MEALFCTVFLCSAGETLPRLGTHLQLSRMVNTKAVKAGSESTSQELKTKLSGFLSCCFQGPDYVECKNTRNVILHLLMANIVFASLFHRARHESGQ